MMALHQDNHYSVPWLAVQLEVHPESLGTQVAPNKE